MGLGLNIVMQNVLGRMSPEEIMELVQKGENSLVVLTSGIFPTARWGAEAMIYHNQLSGFMSLLIYAGFSILIFMILLWLAQLIYLKGAAGLSETGSKRNKQGRKQLAEEAVRGSVIGTYTRTELKLLFRTPIYFINCVMINFLWPIFILLPLIFQPEEINVIRELSQVMNRPGIEGMILAGAFIAALFFSASNGITSTSISREGQELFIKKYLPVSYRQQLTAKILSGFLLGLVSVLSMIIFGILVLKISIWLSLLILAVVWLPVLYTSLTGLLIDLYNPKLDGTANKKAVKQNINVLYNMLAAFVPAIGAQRYLSSPSACLLHSLFSLWNTFFSACCLASFCLPKGLNASFNWKCKTFMLPACLPGRLPGNSCRIRLYLSIIRQNIQKT